MVARVILPDEAPPDFDDTVQALRRFPDDIALDRMHKLGVTHIVVHRTGDLKAREAAINSTSVLRLMAEQDDIAIYRLVRRW